MAMSLEESKKNWSGLTTFTDTFHLVKKIVKIGPVDPEMALLNLKLESVVKPSI